MKSIVIAALLGAICIEPTEAIQIEQLESIRGEPSAADEYDAAVKEEKDQAAKEAKKEAEKEAKKDEAKKEAEKQKELIEAERSVRNEEEENRKEKNIEEQKAKALNDAVVGDKFAGGESKEFNEMNRKWYDRDQKATKARLDAPLLAKGIRTPHRLDDVAPEDRSTAEETEWQAREATLKENAANHKAKVDALEKKWAGDGEDFTANMCADMVAGASKCPVKEEEKKGPTGEAKKEEAPAEAAALQVRKN